MRRETVGRDGESRLEKLEVFASLSVAERRMLARLVDELTADAGETIMREGDFGYEVLIIEEGSAEVLQGGEQVRVLGPGDFLGELAVLAGGSRRTATVLATAPLRALVLTASFLRDVRDRMPSVGERIERAAAERVARDARANAAEPAPASE